MKAARAVTQRHTSRSRLAASPREDGSRDAHVVRMQNPDHSASDPYEMFIFPSRFAAWLEAPCLTAFPWGRWQYSFHLGMSVGNSVECLPTVSGRGHTATIRSRGSACSLWAVECPSRFLASWQDWDKRAHQLIVTIEGACFPVKFIYCPFPFQIMQFTFFFSRSLLHHFITHHFVISTNFLFSFCTEL